MNFEWQTLKVLLAKRRTMTLLDANCGGWSELFGILKKVAHEGDQLIFKEKQGHPFIFIRLIFSVDSPVCPMGCDLILLGNGVLDLEAELRKLAEQNLEKLEDPFLAD